MLTVQYVGRHAEHEPGGELRFPRMLLKHDLQVQRVGREMFQMLLQFGKRLTKLLLKLLVSVKVLRHEVP